jgi:sn-glycerol 3-phosphate transport system substrate-binding protein
MVALLVSACSSSSSSQGAVQSSSASTSVSETGSMPAPGTASVTEPSGAGTTTSPGRTRCAAHVDDPAVPVRVVVWEILGGDEAPRVFDDQLAEFRAAHPGIDVVVESMSGANEMLASLQSTPPEGWPDAVMASPQALRRLVDTGRIVPPTDCPGGGRVEEGLIPVVRELYRYDGQLQGVPYGVSTPVLFYDKVEFRAAGLDPDDPPTTLDELAAVSAQLVESGASPRGLVVTDWYAHYLMLGGAVQRSELVVAPDNGRSGGALKAQFDTPGNRESMSWLLDVIDTNGGLWIGVTPGGVEDLTRIADPVDGGTMAVHTSAAVGDVLRILEAGSFPGMEMGVGPMPGPGRGATVGGNGWFLIDHGDPQRVGAAFELVSWLSDPGRLAVLAAATGYVSPRLSSTAEPVLVEAWNKYPQLRVSFDQILGQPPTAAAAGPLFGPNSEVDSLLFGFTTAIVEGRTPVAEALAGFDDELDALLAQYDAVVGT